MIKYANSTKKMPNFAKKTRKFAEKRENLQKNSRKYAEFKLKSPKFGDFDPDPTPPLPFLAPPSRSETGPRTLCV